MKNIHISCYRKRKQTLINESKTSGIVYPGQSSDLKNSIKFINSCLVNKIEAGKNIKFSISFIYRDCGRLIKIFLNLMYFRTKEPKRSYEIKVHFYFRRNDHFYLLVRTSLDLTEIEHFSEIPSIVTQTGTF